MPYTTVRRRVRNSHLDKLELPRSVAMPQLVLHQYHEPQSRHRVVRNSWHWITTTDISKPRVSTRINRLRPLISFTAATPSPDLLVSAGKALELANRTTLSNLTQPPIKTTVEFVTYTDPARQIENKNVWKVTYWGAPLVVAGPPPTTDGSRLQVAQPSSRRAITYVLLDPMNPNPKDDFISRVSAGPSSD